MGCASSKASDIVGGAQGTAPQDPAKVFNDTYDLGKKLGEGSFGQVRLTREKKSMEVCAVKILSNVRDPEAMNKPDLHLAQAAKEEMVIWQKVGEHKHCVQFHKAYMGSLVCYLTMELCDCSLVEKLESHEFSSEMEVPRMFYEMMLGIEHLHSLSIVHRDIKPCNYLLGTDKTTVKLTDFGLSAVLPAKKKKLKGIYGTAPYMSPEMLSLNGGYDEGTDIWSFAATAYVILFGDFPYMPSELTSTGMKRAILNDYPKPKFVADASIDWKPPGIAVDFVKSLLNRKVSERPSIKLALSHPFVSKRSASTVSGSPVSLKPMLTRITKNSREFKTRIDPTVQRNLDELLEKLQGSNPNGIRRSFSSGMSGLEGTESLPVRRNSRISTHSGILTVSTASLSDVDVSLTKIQRDKVVNHDLSTEEGSSTKSSKDSPASPEDIAANSHYWEVPADLEKRVVTHRAAQ